MRLQLFVDISLWKEISTYGGVENTSHDETEAVNVYAFNSLRPN